MMLQWHKVINIIEYGKNKLLKTFHKKLYNLQQIVFVWLFSLQKERAKADGF